MFLSCSGSDYEGEEEEEDEYDELDHREEGQFWITHDDGVEYAETDDWIEDPVEEKHEKPEPVISLFALGTLCRFFFHTLHANSYYNLLLIYSTHIVYTKYTVLYSRILIKF